jgi:hypothetical protein
MFKCRNKKVYPLNTQCTTGENQNVRVLEDVEIEFLSVQSLRYWTTLYYPAVIDDCWNLTHIQQVTGTTM